MRRWRQARTPPAPAPRCMAPSRRCCGPGSARHAGAGTAGTPRPALPEGRVLGVEPRTRLDSHRLIEEFMVAANVAAAEELERLVQPCMYRVHDRPSEQKLEGLRQFLGSFGITLPPGDQVYPRNFAQALEKLRDAPEAPLVHEAVLRGQSQAEYSPENIGHFGLALPRYAHFTSPIAAMPTCWCTGR
ncbi:RNB domain-containing ribonuclease [Siccirubricoccus deserti]